MACLRALPALKEGTLEALIFIFSPVWGFLPSLALRSLTENFPKPVILTSSPPLSASVTTRSKAPKYSWASLAVTPASSAILSMSSVLFMAFPLCRRLLAPRRPRWRYLPAVCTGGGAASQPRAVGGFVGADPVGVRRGTCTTSGTGVSGADTRGKDRARRTPAPDPIAPASRRAVREAARAILDLALLPERGVGNRACQAPASTPISDPIEGRPNSSQALPPRRKSSIHTVSSPDASLHPLLPGAKASSPSSTPKLPSLAVAVSSSLPMRTRTAAPGLMLCAPPSMVVFRLP